MVTIMKITDEKLCICISLIVWSVPGCVTTIGELIGKSALILCFAVTCASSIAVFYNIVPPVNC